MNGHGQDCEFFHWFMALLVSWNRSYTIAIAQGEQDVFASKRTQISSFKIDSVSLFFLGNIDSKAEEKFPSDLEGYRRCSKYLHLYSLKR